VSSSGLTRGSLPNAISLDLRVKPEDDKGAKKAHLIAGTINDAYII
jgi:hypothetical protein